MTEDIHDIVNRVMKDLDSDKRHIMIEDYINRVATSIQDDCVSVLLAISPDDHVLSEVRQWSKGNMRIFAYKVGQAVRIMLRQELLGEQ